ncbi:hypothetical protein KKG83_05050 [Candidatus Micrarchaeota archaeon]|nr:hypothetical protein [Candidatus Micrarchaeota archaeon]
MAKEFLVKIGLKFLGAACISWALFSLFFEFSTTLFPLINYIGMEYSGPGFAFPTGEMVAFAIGLTLLLADFDFLFKK